ncbi:ATP-binding cassette domain-containing protein [Streptomyces olivochromogenes]|uniref:ATP-binding cassette domain-containing protein n=1 Tax=Streptomyces olivochromogenes TaxID=1963 RepID=UPI001F47CB56|nr:ATP-binding cassette domain-containing protein [Streptomyces olivochromogenes]MCF3131165.1 ATP-binding cassette domain-containing protein [Streptomyces olivochromogenes]
MTEPLLRVRDLDAHYGGAQALRQVSLHVTPGEVVTLVGRNGAGKTTLLRCVMGLHTATAGEITLAGRDIGALPAHRRARLGLGHVPDDRGIYAGLSVAEHLAFPHHDRANGWTLERIHDTFPVLADRRRTPAAKLSGGEQQFLALARVLRMGSRVMLCDEPTEGLAPGELAGAFLEPQHSQMGADLIITVFAVVVIGGLGSVPGAVVAGFTIGMLQALGNLYVPVLSQTSVFLLMAVVLLARPAGLFGKEGQA